MIKKLYNSPFFGRLFHTMVSCLQKELSDCETVLDLGCGPSSPIQSCNNIKYSVGVEAFTPYLNESRKKKIHSKYLNKKIENIDFPQRSFDAVIMIEVIEHLPEKEAFKVLKKAEKWSKKKLIVTCPNGFLPQKAVDKNKWQKHLSGWDCRKMRELGFEVKGLAGLRFLRTEVQSETMGDDLTTSIKYRPKIFWFVLATLSQLFSYHFPTLAFELFNVKLIDEEKHSQKSR